MNKPTSITFSIITPVYNGARFISSCIENVIEQNCPVAEHLILDACSTDGTVDIIRSYAERYSHIRWISEKDGGQSDAMNKGIAMARGSVLGFLNVDDYYEPGVLNRAGEIFLTQREPAFVAADCNVWDDNGNLMFVTRPSRLRLVDLLMGANVNPWPINPSSYFYSRSLHDRVGLYDVNEHYALDLEFLLRAVQKAHVVYVPEIWGNYRFITGTKTHNDHEVGQSLARSDALLEYYRKDLSPYERNLFGLLRYMRIMQLFCEHWFGYVKNPALFFNVLKAKTKRTFNQ